MIKCLSWFNSKFQARKTKKKYIFGEGKTLTDPNERVQEPDKKCCKYIHSTGLQNQLDNRRRVT